MILENGNIFSMIGKTDLLLVTTNSEKKYDGRLIMGRGAALQIRQALPNDNLDLLFGRQIYNPIYGLVIVELPVQRVGGFQTKINWREPSTYDLIKLSTRKLFSWLLEHPEVRVDLNFPGIGEGGLDRGRVLKIISLLPNNVHIWERE